MKRLLMTGLLGLALINHVHAGSLTQYLPTVTTVKNQTILFTIGCLFGTLPLAVRAAILVPCAYFNEQKISHDGKKIEQTALAYSNPFTKVTNRIRAAFGETLSNKQYAYDLINLNRQANKQDLDAIDNIENMRIALNATVASISAFILKGVILKLAGVDRRAGVKSDPALEFVSDLPNAVVTGLALSCAISFGTCLPALISCIKDEMVRKIKRYVMPNNHNI